MNFRIWWLWIGLLSVTLLGSSELFWRYKGFKTNVVDSEVLWATLRSQVYTENLQKKIVIVGTSRAQLGIDPEILADRFPGYGVVHLAIDGASPLPIIQDLCQDEAFDGVLICDVTVPFLNMRKGLAQRTELQYLTYYKNEFHKLKSLEKRFNTKLETQLQANIVIQSTALSFKSLLYNRLHPKWLYLHMNLNRHRPAFYTDRMSSKECKEHRIKRIEREKERLKPIPMETFQPLAQDKLKQLNHQLRKRGGRMIFVRMPTVGDLWHLEEGMAPKAHFWDRIETWSGIPTIHFRDYDTLASFDCPDASHLDARDVPEFTRRLSDTIHQKLAIFPNKPSKQAQ